MKNIPVILLLIIFLLAACAPIPQNYQPIIDTGASNFSWDQYYKDLRECRAYAERISPANQAAGEALAGAAFGAALGAILGTGYHNVGQSAGIGAGITGLTGAAHGAGSAIEKQKRIINRCLAGRGYRVLN